MADDNTGDIFGLFTDLIRSDDEINSVISVVNVILPEIFVWKNNESIFCSYALNIRA